jgi:hypothetical protein
MFIDGEESEIDAPGVFEVTGILELFPVLFVVQPTINRIIKKRNESNTVSFLLFILLLNIHTEG